MRNKRHRYRIVKERNEKNNNSFYEFEYFNLICILKRLMLMVNVKKVRHSQGKCFSQQNLTAKKMAPLMVDI